MRRAEVFMCGIKAGVLEEREKRKKYSFRYDEDYCGKPVSLTLPLSTRNYEFDSFPTFFEGLLPEGFQLDALLRIKKIDRLEERNGNRQVRNAPLFPRLLLIKNENRIIIKLFKGGRK